MVRREPTWVLTGMGGLDALGPGERPVVTLDWPPALDADPWLALLLPGRSYNEALLAALDGARLPRNACVGVFLAHPFVDMDRMLRAIERSGARGIAAFPGISRLGDAFASAAEQGGLSLATEGQRLVFAAERGFDVMASVGHPGMGPPLVRLRPDWVLAAPEVPRDELPGAARGILDYRPADGTGPRRALPRRAREAREQ